ncbi:MAG TPA: hypothetical protein VJ779_09575 [Acetobacteraceae bacterium]|nr:hypothetical protein [Acetobacteraceae bacterium]
MSGTQAPTPIATFPSPVASDAPHPSVSQLQQKVLDRLSAIIDGIITMRVTTAVGTVTAAKVENIREATEITLATQGEEIASTAMNMALGDCTIVMTKAFIDTPAYVQLHNQAVTEAKAIRQNTMDLLKQAIQAVAARL